MASDEPDRTGQGSGLVNEVLDALDGEPELYRRELPQSTLG